MEYFFQTTPWHVSSTILGLWFQTSRAFHDPNRLTDPVFHSHDRHDLPVNQQLQ
jgi:hypothetical protein